MLKNLFYKSFRKFSLLAILALALNFTPLAQDQIAHAADCNEGLPVCEVAFPPNATVEQKAATTCPAGFRITGTKDTGIQCQKDAAAKLTDKMNEKLVENIGIIQIIVNVLSRILWPVLAMIGGLMDNSLLFGNGMEARLREIWIVVRNLVNIFFVLVLVGIALYNVLGLGEDGGNYSVKAALPKIVIALIAINFSFLAIKVFLDVVNVMTTAVFALPQQVDEQLADITLTTEQQQLLCGKITQVDAKELSGATIATLGEAKTTEIYRKVASTETFKGSFDPPLGDKLSSLKPSEIEARLKPDQVDKFKQAVAKEQRMAFCDPELKLTNTGQAYFSKYGQQNAAFAMALSMGKITLYDTVIFENLGNAKAIEKITMSLILSIVLYVVYAASFLALLIVLLGRLVFLWISIAISPVLLLLMASPELKGVSSKLGELPDQFIKNAIAPLIIGFVMSIGWIMNRTLQNVNSFGENPVLGGIDPTGGLPIAGLNTLQDVLVAAITVAIVWVGVFAAADNTIASGVTTWIKDKVAGAGKFIATVPLKHAPLFPVKVAGGQVDASVGELGAALSQKMNELDSMNSPKSRDNINSLLSNKLVQGSAGLPAAHEMRSVETPEDLKKNIAQLHSVGNIPDPALVELQANPQRMEIIRKLNNSTGENRERDRKLAQYLQNLGDAKDAKARTEISTKIRNLRHPELELSDDEKAKLSGTTVNPATVSNIEIQNTTLIGSTRFDQIGADDEQKKNFQIGINSLAKALSADQTNDLTTITKNLEIKGKDPEGNEKTFKPTQTELKQLLNQASPDLAKKLTTEIATTLGIIEP
ncbi:hypothetical protein KA119_01340 [Candidatus Gracilibacteria bacterium]|nr:hypothetical protein [Candidatus Gracilibacteria bacterium]